MTFKPLTKEDLPFYIEVHNHPSTLKYLGDDKFITLKEAEKWFSGYKNMWYVISKDEKVGIFKTLQPFDIMDGLCLKRWVEIGCDIHPDYRRRGYAREAYKIVLDKLDDIGAKSFLRCFFDNPALSLYKELGFEVNEKETKIIYNRKYIKMTRI